MTHLEGVLVGGDEPLCSSLAVYVAELQKLKHISLLVTVINHPPLLQHPARPSCQALHPHPAHINAIRVLIAPTVWRG
eukprot:1060421-Rhodomonas_salina.1